MLLKWDEIGERLYETGVSHPVIYKPGKAEGSEVMGYHGEAAAWNGFTNFDENPKGGEPTKYYANNSPYAVATSMEELDITIQAYMYPDAFEEHNGGAELAKGVIARQQVRKPFGFSVQTIVNNDVEEDLYGVKYHLIYGVRAQPSPQSFKTTNQNPELNPMSWSCTTTPEKVEGLKPTASITLNSKDLSAKQIKSLEEALYGTATAKPYLPTPAELVELLELNKVTEEIEG